MYSIEDNIKVILSLEFIKIFRIIINDRLADNLQLFVHC